MKRVREPDLPGRYDGRGSRSECVVEATASSVRREARDWIEENFDPELSVRAWLERLADSGWAAARLARRVVRQGAPAGPGRGRLRGVQPRRRAGPPAGLGVMLAAPTIIANGSDDLKRQFIRAMLVGDHALVPAVQRARSRVRPGRLADQGGTRRRRVHRQRPEGLDVGRPDRRLRDAARPHRPGRAQAPRHHLLRAADEPAGGRGAAADPDDRRVRFQRGVLLRRAGAGIRDHRGAERRVGRGAVHAGLRAHVARHRERAGVPAQRAGREQVPAAAGGLGRRVHRRRRRATRAASGPAAPR